MGVFDKFSGIGVASGFKLQAKMPLDPRQTVDSISDRDALITENGAYEGMQVYVKADKKTYLLKDLDAGTWEEVGEGSAVTDYNDLTNIPIINEDLLAFSEPVKNTYYLHTGLNRNSFVKGTIYFYDGDKYNAINGTSSLGTDGPLYKSYTTGEGESDEAGIKYTLSENLTANRQYLLRISSDSFTDVINIPICISNLPSTAEDNCMVGSYTLYMDITGGGKQVINVAICLNLNDDSQQYLLLNCDAIDLTGQAYTNVNDTWLELVPSIDIYLLEGGGAGGSSVQSDYNQNDSTADDYIKNRPFYSETGTTTLFEQQFSTTAVSSINYWATNSTVIQLTLGDTVTVTYNGTEYTEVVKSLQGQYYVGNVALMGMTPNTGEPFALANFYLPDYFSSQTFTAGTSIVTYGAQTNATIKVTSSAEIIHKMNSKYIEGMYYANTTSSTKMDTTITTAAATATDITFLSYPYVGELCKVTFDGVVYECRVKTIISTPYIGEPWTNSTPTFSEYPFSIRWTTSNCKIITKEAYSGEIKVVQCTTAPVVGIDDMFIGNCILNIGTVTDLPSIASKLQSLLDANDALLEKVMSIYTSRITIVGIYTYDSVTSMRVSLTLKSCYNDMYSTKLKSFVGEYVPFILDGTRTTTNVMVTIRTSGTLSVTLAQSAMVDSASKFTITDLLSSDSEEDLYGTAFSGTITTTAGTEVVKSASVPSGPTAFFVTFNSQTYEVPFNNTWAGDPNLGEYPFYIRKISSSQIGITTKDAYNDDFTIKYLRSPNKTDSDNDGSIGSLILDDITITSINGAVRLDKWMRFAQNHSDFNPPIPVNGRDIVNKAYVDGIITLEDLTLSTFTPVANSYYQHTGLNTTNFTQGKIYFYNGTTYILADGTAVNNLVINRDSNGVLKIGDTVIPQKKTLWEGSQTASHTAAAEITLSESLSDGDVLEFEYVAVVGSRNSVVYHSTASVSITSSGSNYVCVVYGFNISEMTDVSNYVIMSTYCLLFNSVSSSTASINTVKCTGEAEVTQSANGTSATASTTYNNVTLKKIRKIIQ